jgi:hypothetical protein
VRRRHVAPLLRRDITGAKRRRQTSTSVADAVGGGRSVAGDSPR